MYGVELCADKCLSMRLESILLQYHHKVLHLEIEHIVQCVQRSTAHIHRTLTRAAWCVKHI